MLGCPFRKIEMFEVKMQFIEAHKTMWISFDIKLEIVDYLRRYPPGTQLRPWKTGTVENQYVNTRLSELPGARGPCRTTSND
jgi:hypothetical protein